MHGTFRHSGGAGRIEPISDIVGAGSGRRRAFVLGRQKRVKSRHRRGATANHDNCLEVRQVDRRLLNDRQQCG